MKQLIDYEGRRVRLTPERERHIAEHSEMSGLIPAIESMIQAPEKVIRSRSDAHVELFYRFVPATIVGDKWLCAVIKYSDDGAFVLTAYLTDRPKTGETIWPKP